MTEALSQLNFRDIGGLPVGGGRVRRGVLFRSEGPASYDPTHHEELRALGIRLVCDLRSNGEQAKDPHSWSQGARIVSLDVTADFRVPTAGGGFAALRDDQTPAAVQRILLANYEAMPAAILPHLRDVIEAVVSGEVPVLINCTAGKDRTGVMVALLLLAMGASEEPVIDDYLRSEVYGRNLRRRGGLPELFEQNFGFRPTDALINAMTGVDEMMLRAALAVVDRDHGSVAGYFAAAGVSDGLLLRFRDAVVEVTSPPDDVHNLI